MSSTFSWTLRRRRSPNCSNGSVYRVSLNPLIIVSCVIFQMNCVHSHFPTRPNTQFKPKKKALDDDPILQVMLFRWEIWMWVSSRQSRRPCNIKWNAGKFKKSFARRNHVETWFIIHLYDINVFKSLFQIRPQIDFLIWQCVKALYPFCSHQNSWDLWMFIPLKMVFL